MYSAPFISAFPVDIACVHHRIQHEHTFHEFYFSLSDGGTQFAEQAAYPLSIGTVFSLPAGVPHLCSAHSPDSLPKAIVVFVSDNILPDTAYGDRISRNVLQTLIESGRKGSHAFEMDLGPSSRLHSALLKLCEEANRQSIGREVALKIRLQEVLLEVMRDPKQQSRFNEASRPSSGSGRLPQLLGYIETQYREPITVQDAARIACLSRSHFHAQFKEATGTTFVDYLNRYRIRIACQLLENEALPILDIAEACGFNNLGTFYRCFRNETGLAPGQYRDKHSGTPYPLRLRGC